MLNIRGNTYSRNHTHLDPCSSCKEFWSFGLEEGALLDYPVVIDYIVAATGYEDMHFVGYSMGTTQYLMLLSEMPGRLLADIQAGGFNPSWDKPIMLILWRGIRLNY